jgi:outer membrane lipoprotein-sorting protein
VSARKLLSSPLLGVLLAGCAIAVAPPRQPVSEEARAALALLIERWHAFSDLRTFADIVVERGGQRQRITGALLAKAPDSIRFEALSPFGAPLLVSTINGGQLIIYDAASNEATVGPATAETAARVLGLALDADDLVGVLAGRTVPPKDLRTAQIVVADSDGPSLDLVGRLHRQRVWMDFSTGIVRQFEYVGGRYAARVVFHRDERGTLTGLDLDAAAGHVKATVRYDQPVIDGGVEPDRLSFTVPKGAKIQTIR